jgi:UDP-glucose 4-epimerase
MDFKGLPVLVTGGAGFIGSHLTGRLVELGAKVTVLDNLQAGRWENLAGFSGEVEFVEGDVRDYKLVEACVRGKEVIFHEAANASVPNSIGEPVYDLETNALGTLNLLEASRKSKGNPFLIYASTAGVYGEPVKVPIREDHPLQPISPYGVSKLAAEMYCRMYYEMYTVRTVSLRYFNVYGPRQPRYVLHDFVEKLRRDPCRLEVLGTGEQTRDFIYVSDCVDATLHAVEAHSLLGQAVNVGTGTPTRISDLAEIVVELLGLKGKTEIYYTGKSWQGDVQILIADISKLLISGFKPKIDLKKGLDLFIKWYFSSSINRK